MTEIDYSQIQKELQAELQQIIVAVAGAEMRDIPDDVPILDLGVSSLQLVEGIRQVYDRFGVLVSIRRVIEGQVTLGGLALYIHQELLARQGARQTDAKKSDGNLALWKPQREIPLAPSQQHIAFLSRYSAEASAAFHITLAVRLDGLLHGPALQAAVEEVGNRYEALRTSLNPDADSLIIGSGEPLELAGSRTTEERLPERLSDIVRQPFKTGSRLFRAELLRINDNLHVLILVGHQLVLEQQSLALVLGDISQLYHSFVLGEKGSAPQAAIQWSDYLAMGETAEARQAHHQDQDYWMQSFASGVPLLELPHDHPRPQVKKYNGARLAAELDPAVWQEIKGWADHESLDPTDVLLASFLLYLHRLSGQNEVLVGLESQPFYADAGILTVARTRNMLPIRSIYEPQQSYQAYLKQLAAVVEQAQIHRQLSLAEMIQLLNLHRDQGRSALFSVGFRSFEQAPAPEFKDLSCTYLDLPSSGARYDLELIVRLEDHRVTLICDYSTELFDDGTIARCLRGLQALLSAGVKDARQKCGLLPVMPDDERRQIEVEWNNTAKDYPSDKTILDLILDQALLHPDAPALCFLDETLTYRQLAERIDYFAGILNELGVGRGDRLGVLLKRSLDLVPVLLAAWRVGAVYVPMDASFPGKRLAYILEDANVQIVLTHREYLPLLYKESGISAICIDDESAGIQGTPGQISPAAGSDSAMILYTSGSTGRPKGVEIRHRAVLNCLLATSAILEFGPTSRMLALTTITFDVSENEIFMPLLAGGCVDLGEDGLVGNGVALAERLQQARPTHLQATPSTYKALLAGGWQGDKDISLLSVGEALSRDLAEQLLERCGQLWDLYGPTETTIYSAAYRVLSMPGQPMRIGKPLQNTEFYILDGQLQTTPLGAVGEIYIGGEGLAIGYWQKPELTQERFIPSPFDPSRRIYRTGDLGYYLPDGNMVYLGRADDQVKIHGVRMELGEIEMALREIPGVRDAAAAAWKDGRGDLQLVAHIIPGEDGSALSPQGLRLSLRERLPEVMVPLYFLFTEAFPMTANGKIHRLALPAPVEARQDETGVLFEPPATSTERTLTRAWAEILEIDASRIGREADFMDLGGHSLLMTRLMVEVRKEFQVSFTMREFFEASTIRKFGKLIDERKRQETGKRSASLASAPKRSPEWARQRMAFLTREAQLPLYIAPRRGLTYQPQAGLHRVLMTGATGFLGAYLVSEILSTTQVELYCLVRPRRDENSKERIQRQMQKYHVWKSEESWQRAWQERVHVVDGDVTLPRLGMADAVYESLAVEIDAILHGAAHVNFIYPYEALRATNVLGIHEIIQFAFYQRIKPVHHLSTAAIWPMGAQYTFYEKDSIDHMRLLNLGYDEAKWVGEKCLLNAAERGLPVARYRPGEVGGDSLTGRCVTDHFVIACVKGFLQFGAFPDLDIEVDVAPVDYVAKAMVYLAFHRDPLGRAFHLTNPHRQRTGESLAFLRSQGYQFDVAPFEELRDRLVSSPDFSRNALFAYQAALEEMDHISMQLPTYDTRETERELAGSGIACAPADNKLFGNYLSYLQNIGFIPQPEALLARP